MKLWSLIRAGEGDCPSVKRKELDGSIMEKNTQLV